MSKRNPIIAAVPGRFAPLYIPAVIDLVLVLIFCAIGRRSHDETGALAGLATTAWPFLIGAVVGWAASWALYRDKFDAFLLLPTGIIVWVSTVAIGMVLRAIIGQGTAFSFVVVATTVLALFLLGWRALARVVSARKN